MHPAAPAGFWIWRNRRGKWRLRTTSGSGPRPFRGTITGVTSTLTGVTTSRPDIADRVRPVPNGVRFELGPSPFMDGLDFEVEGPACVRFELEVDSGTGPATITVGAGQLHPDQPSFVLCP